MCLQDAALNEPAAPLDLLLEGCGPHLKILDPTRFDVGREDGGLLLELRLFALQGRALAVQLLGGLLLERFDLAPDVLYDKIKQSPTKVAVF